VAVFARARERWPLSAETYEKIALAALVSLVLVVLTGAAVRLTGSGLGCPTWPKCTRTSLQPQLNSYALIEFGNRVLIFFVSAAALLAVVGALLRRPAERRRDLLWLSLLLPVGVVGQAVIGGESVLHKLAPGWVMSHYWLSMVILVAAFELWWRSRLEPEEIGRPGADRTTILAVRLIALVAVVVILLGSAATAAGPHAGASGTGQLVQRLHFWGGDTVRRLIHVHGYLVTLMGLGTLGAWWLARRRGTAELARTLRLVCLLLAAQGAIGIAQYELALPSELVWVHVTLATLTWVGYVHAWTAAGTLPGRLAGAPPPAQGSTGRPEETPASAIAPPQAISNAATPTP
jgi:cytochrome c oxidase assembly protein subunit 15